MRPALLGGILAGALFAITVFEVAARDRILPGVIAVGQPVGWLDQSQAATQIAPSLGAFLDRPIQIQHQNHAWTVTSRDLGMRGDAGELAAAAYRVGREGSIFSRALDHVRALIGGTTVPVDSGVDQARLDQVIAQVASEIDRPSRDARIAISADGSVDYVSARVGLTTDVAAFRARVLRTLAEGGSVVDLPVHAEHPGVTDDLVQPAFAQVSRMLGGTGTPLTLTRGQESWALDRADVAALVTIEGGTPDGQKATVTIDDARLEALVRRLARDVDQDVQNARFSFNGGNLTVLKPSREGRTLDQAATAALIKSKLLAGERTAELTVTAVQPEISGDNPAALGIVERIETASTSFAGSIPEKKWNIQLAAERLNGVIVPPGGTFSFNKEVGPTTLEAGFKWGLGIESGRDGARTVPSVGGGICQVATTLFHPVFWAGYPLEERFWHLYWIPAYTSRGIVGLDVTVDEDAKLDFRWTNPTNDYILIQSATDNDRVYFSLYGKKPPWQVQVDEPVITNRVPFDPKPAMQEDPAMPWGRQVVVQTARDGFDVLVTRRVLPDGGGEPRVLRLRSKYQAVPTLTLVGTAGRPAGAPLPTLPGAASPTATSEAGSGGSATPSAAGTPAAASRPSPTAAVAPSSSSGTTAPGGSMSTSGQAGASSTSGSTGAGASGSAGTGAPPASSGSPSMPPVDQNRPVGSGGATVREETGDLPSLRGAVALTPAVRPESGSSPRVDAPEGVPQGQSSAGSSVVVAPGVAGSVQQVNAPTRP